MSNFCEYYEKCGGCTQQHLSSQEYKGFKQGILIKILTRLGCDQSIMDDLIEVGANSRRRVEFKISVNKGNVSLGFYAPKSHDVIDIDNCPVTEKDISSLIPHFRKLIGTLKKPGNIKAINITAITIS